MKAQELRLRNLVKDESGAIYYVSSISLDIDDEYNELIGATPFGETSGEIIKEERELYWQPIPLTEDRLERAGFKKNGVEWKGIICLQSFGGYIHYSAGEGIKLGVALRYVHQLQNLVYDLTHEELTFQS